MQINFGSKNKQRWSQMIAYDDRVKNGKKISVILSNDNEKRGDFWLNGFHVNFVLSCSTKVRGS
jgi:predicted HAD superfamily phosphohydrolase YqeG